MVSEVGPDDFRPPSVRRYVPLMPKSFVLQPIIEDGLELLREVGEVEVFDYVVSLSDTPIDAEIMAANTVYGERPSSGDDLSYDRVATK
jgi:hypothetical protein